MEDDLAALRTEVGSLREEVETLKREEMKRKYQVAALLDDLRKCIEKLERNEADIYRKISLLHRNGKLY